MIRRAVRRPVSLATHLVHQLVGVQAALHERLDLASPRHGDGPLGGLVAVARRHEPVRPEVDGLRGGDGADLRLRADEHRNDEPGPRRARSPRGASSGPTGWTTAVCSGSRPFARARRLRYRVSGSPRRTVRSAPRLTLSDDAITSARPSTTSSPAWFTQRQSRLTRSVAGSLAVAVTETVSASPSLSGRRK